MPKPTFFKLPDDKRQRITEHALDEFSAYPYRQASLSRIVARAGIAKGSMYQYFDNKLDLYEWLVTVELERRREAWLQTRAGSYPAGEGGLFATLERMIMARVGFLLADPRLARLAASAMEPTPDTELRSLHQALRHRHVEALVARIREAQLAGEIRANAEARALAHFLDALIVRGTAHALLDRLGVEAHELEQRGRIEDGHWRAIVDQALDLVHGGIRAVVEDRPRGSQATAGASANPSAGAKDLDPEARPASPTHVN